MVDADFENSLESLMRADTPASDSVRLVEPIMERVEAESRRRAWLLGVFTASGAALTAGMLATVAKMGVAALDFAWQWPPAQFDVRTQLIAGAVIVALGGGSFLAIRVSRAL